MSEVYEKVDSVEGMNVGEDKPTPANEETIRVDENGREIVEVYLDDLQELISELDELEKEEDIGDKIERVLVEERNVYLSGIISEETVDPVVAMIHYYGIQDKNNRVPDGEKIPIKLILDSPGGSMSSGKKLLSAIENSSTPIETVSQGGQLASMAFVIFLASDVRKMSRHSEPMYHNLLAGTEGTFSELKNQISYYERLQNEMDEYVVERTKIPMKKLKKLRSKNQDWHLTFKEAEDYGVFTHRI